MGWHYATGYGIDIDQSIAVEWYEKAAGQGNKEAENALRSMKKTTPGINNGLAQIIRKQKSS